MGRRRQGKWKDKQTCCARLFSRLHDDSRSSENDSISNMDIDITRSMGKLLVLGSECNHGFGDRCFARRCHWCVACDYEGRDRCGRRNGRSLLGADDETGGSSRSPEYGEVRAILDQMGGWCWDLLEVREQYEWQLSLHQQWLLLNDNTRPAYIHVPLWGDLWLDSKLVRSSQEQPCAISHRIAWAATFRAGDRLLQDTPLPYTLHGCDWVLSGRRGAWEDWRLKCDNNLPLRIKRCGGGGMRPPFPTCWMIVRPICLASNIIQSKFEDAANMTIPKR